MVSQRHVRVPARGRPAFQVFPAGNAVQLVNLQLLIKEVPRLLRPGYIDLQQPVVIIQAAAFSVFQERFPLFLRGFQVPQEGKLIKAVREPLQHGPAEHLQDPAGLPAAPVKGAREPPQQMAAQVQVGYTARELMVFRHRVPDQVEEVGVLVLQRTGEYRQEWTG